MGDRLGIIPPASYDDPCPYIERQLRRHFPVLAVDTRDVPLPDARHEQRKLIPLGLHSNGLSVGFNECSFCRKCVPLRILVKDYPYTRKDARTIGINRGLQVSLIEKPVFTMEHFALHRQYVRERHPKTPIEERFFGRLRETMGDHSGFIEMRTAEGKLACVAVFDEVDNGLNAFSIFYDPALSKSRRSLGTFAMLQMIAVAEHKGLEHLYIGNWVENSRTTGYKAQFGTLEARTTEGWVRFDPAQHRTSPDFIKILAQNKPAAIVVVGPKVF